MCLHHPPFHQWQGARRGTPQELRTLLCHINFAAKLRGPAVTRLVPRNTCFADLREELPLRYATNLRQAQIAPNTRKCCTPNGGSSRDLQARRGAPLMHEGNGLTLALFRASLRESHRQELKTRVDGKEPCTVIDDRHGHALARIKNFLPHGTGSLRANEPPRD
ncbi:hypothetical protein D3C80_1374850 [compost metagenome]